MKSPIKVILPIALLLLVAGGSVFWYTYQKKKEENSVVSGTLQAGEVEFGSRQGGRIDEIRAEEGQLLKEEEVILVLEQEELKAQRDALAAQLEAQKNYLLQLKHGLTKEEIDQAHADFKRAQAQYELMREGTRQEDIASSKAARDSIKAELERAQQSLARKEALFKEQVISKDYLEEVQSKVSVLQQRYEEASKQYEKAQSGFRKEEVDQSYYTMKAREAQYHDAANGTRSEVIAAEESRQKMYEAQLKEISEHIDELTVKSPCNCQLAEFDLKKGNLILPNQTLGTLIDLQDLWVDAYLPEQFYGRIQIGDPVEITSFAYPGKTFSGQVSFVGLESEFTPRNIQTIEGRKQQVFKVKVRLDNPDNLFRPGMDLNLRFETDAPKNTNSPRRM